MRVLHIITSLSTGGAERALFNLLSGGLGQASETVVLSLTNDGTFGEQISGLGIRVYTLNMRRGLPSISAFIRLRRVMRDFRPDLIQGWMYHGNLIAVLAGILAERHPAVVWNVRHSLYSLKNEKWLTRQVICANRFISSKADKIIYNSRVSKTQHQAFGFAADKSVVIPNGFDTEVLRPDPDKRNMMRQVFGIADTETVIGHVARFHPLKNHAGFLQAAVTVLQTRPDVTFLIVGRDVHLNNPAISGIVPVNLRHRFRFLGERRDVHDVMQAMDVFCLTSSSEAFPNVLAEAMSLEKPCMATDVGDCKIILGNVGHIVPVESPQSFAEAILALLAQPVSARNERGSLARRRIEENYTLSSIVMEYDGLYRHLTMNVRQGVY